MAFSRRFSALGATLLVATASALAAEPALTLAEVIAKARAAAAVEPAALEKIRSLRLEFTTVDDKAGAPTRITLTLAAPGLRHQESADAERRSSSVICAGRLEGWTTRREDPLARREIRPVAYEEFRKLRDMARDDLAFFAAPPAGEGTAEYKGLTTVDDVPTHAIHYAYASGFRITRHFDARTFALVASDQLTPAGELLRQKVSSFLESGGVRFAAKEIVSIEGRKVGEVSYESVTVNPEVPPALFAFPSF